MAPTKRLVLLFDGTDNTPEDNTNVWRTHELVASSDAAGVPQLKKYIKGVGTNVGHIAAGSIFGVGVIDRICDGYRWLVDNYEDGAEIYVFGFSRGAFTARSLVQMIATVGLPRPHFLESWSIRQAFTRYEAISQQQQERIRPLWRLRYWERHPEQAPEGWKQEDPTAARLGDANVRLVKVRMAGLWDTVGAIGPDALKNRLSLTQKVAEHNVRPTKTQDHGYHALAIDEHRPMFGATLWRRFVPAVSDTAAAFYDANYEQRWFLGAHSDVGGGYHDDRLPSYSLSWMLGKAAALGLAFSGTVAITPDSWQAPIHDSYKSFAGGVLNIWNKILPGDQRHYREIGKAPRSLQAASGQAGSLNCINETLDDSVKQRWTNDPAYRPPSLVQFFQRNPGQVP